jgi:U3 small nucleolar RNA-associated protein 4
LCQSVSRCKCDFPSSGCYLQKAISSQGGSIWSFAVNPASSCLALGCEDGSVRLLSLVHDTLVHHGRFDRVKCRSLSIAWGPPLSRRPAKTEDTGTGSESSSEDEDEEEWVDSWLVTGGSDSSLRKWDVATGRVVDRMGTDRMRGEPTLVWAVGVLGSVLFTFFPM